MQVAADTMHNDSLLLHTTPCKPYRTRNLRTLTDRGTEARLELWYTYAVFHGPGVRQCPNHMAMLRPYIRHG